MNTPTTPPAAGKAAHTLTASIGSTGAAFHCDNIASHPLSFRIAYRDPALSEDGQTFAAEVLRRYNSHAALVSALASLLVIHDDPCHITDSRVIDRARAALASARTP